MEGETDDITNFNYRSTLQHIATVLHQTSYFSFVHGLDAGYGRSFSADIVSHWMSCLHGYRSATSLYGDQRSTDRIIFALHFALGDTPESAQLHTHSLFFTIREFVCLLSSLYHQLLDCFYGFLRFPCIIGLAMGTCLAFLASFSGRSSI